MALLEDITLIKYIIIIVIINIITEYKYTRVRNIRSQCCMHVNIIPVCKKTFLEATC